MTNNNLQDEQFEAWFTKEDKFSLATAATKSVARQAWQAALASAEQAEPVAFLVDGRIEQGLFFDKQSAEIMAEANCGTVIPLVAQPSKN
jgi:hypothetical protein